MRLFSLSLWEDSYPELVVVYLHENQNIFKWGTSVVILHKQTAGATHPSNIMSAYVSKVWHWHWQQRRIHICYSTNETSPFNVATSKSLFGWEAPKFIHLQYKLSVVITSCAGFEIQYLSLITSLESAFFSELVLSVNYSKSLIPFLCMDYIQKAYNHL